MVAIVPLSQKQHNQEQFEEWVNASYAAKYLGISKSTVIRRVDAGKLPGYRDGEIIRIRKSDLERYLAEKLSKPQQ